MAEKTIELSFDGYYPQNEDKNEEHLININKHHCSGVYVVYTGKPTVSGECKLECLIYIGEAKDVYERLTKKHKHYEDWINELGQGDRLYFSIADVDYDDRERAEAALIHLTTTKRL